MSNLVNIPSYSSLIERDKMIKALQDLYRAFIDLEGATGYIKPVTGIPASDLDESVQVDLEKIENLVIVNYDPITETLQFGANGVVEYDSTDEEVEFNL